MLPNREWPPSLLRSCVWGEANSCPETIVPLARCIPLVIIRSSTGSNSKGKWPAKYEPRFAACSPSGRLERLVLATGQSMTIRNIQLPVQVHLEACDKLPHLTVSESLASVDLLLTRNPRMVESTRRYLCVSVRSG
jgi:hypothetical protein